MPALGAFSPHHCAGVVFFVFLVLALAVFKFLEFRATPRLCGGRLVSTCVLFLAFVLSNDQGLLGPLGDQDEIVNGLSPVVPCLALCELLLPGGGRLCTVPRAAMPLLCNPVFCPTQFVV